MILHIHLNYFFATVIKNESMITQVPTAQSQTNDFQASAKIEEKPIIIIRNERVLDADPILFKQGLQFNDRRLDAKSVFGSKVHWIEWDQENYKSEQTKWLNALRVYTDEIEVIDQNEAYIGLSSHPQPIYIAQQLSTHLSRLGFSPSIGYANSKWVASVASRLQTPWQMSYLTPRRFLAPLPISFLPIESEIAKQLHWLGYSTIEELSQVPIKNLRNQFGDTAYSIKDACLGIGDRSININFPQKALTAHFWFESVVESKNELDLGLLNISQNLSQIASNQDECAHKLRLRIRFERCQDQFFERTFTQPIQTIRQFQNGFELLIPKIPPKEIIGLVGSALDLKPMPRIQLSLDRETPPETKLDKNRGAITNLQKTFGVQAIRAGAEIDKRQLFMRKFKDAIGWK